MWSWAAHTMVSSWRIHILWFWRNYDDSWLQWPFKLCRFHWSSNPKIQGSPLQRLLYTTQEFWFGNKKTRMIRSLTVRLEAALTTGCPTNISKAACAKISQNKMRSMRSKSFTGQIRSQRVWKPLLLLVAIPWIVATKNPSHSLSKSSR